MASRASRALRAYASPGGFIHLWRRGSRGFATSTSALPRGGSDSGAGGELSSSDLIQHEILYSAHNYHPIPVVFARAKNALVWDPEGRQYLDFLSAYSAVNQGHCHQKILDVLVEQSQRLTLSSRAFHNDKFPTFARLLTRIFGYDMMLPMNTGAEGVETALKLAKKWGYMKKGITKDEALIVSCCGCFHGRTLAAVSMSCDNDATRGFSPLLGGNLKVDFGDADALESIFKEHGDNIAGFLFEPIQGEAGVIVPPEGYLRKVRELCSKYNVLMIADEIQTGMARTGRLLAVEWENVRPDVVILGKALGAGVLPVSAVLADKEVMLCIQPGEHGSTFGGNPLGSAVGIASLEIVQEECLAERAEELGEKLRESLRELQVRHPDVIKEVRGRGLLNAVEMHPVGSSKVTAYDVCLALKERGILAKPTHNTIIRLSPPLTITEEQIQEAVKAFGSVLEDDYSHLKDLSSKRGSVQKPEPCDRCGRVK
ncbi:ornithine--oxo-acid transaminase [Marchantia polymorpha subsp. ruderalis]|uniref:ornithine aminotransferase n=2 Tax=Marchantia polymorpha TaxID=3197 RepID=A0AAF6BXY3_MARPO|nr:hypothetical protein MARPO_0003s0017 [Marchantia polymorpha]BBN16867.1 hypothetical protein Mp_7g09980 [Marchantia polymorpha subsp. ruderalis]|eukprot:PTQ49108.1 hypothetical protein MARPO_0003s0017 [Marchantia polymorpha]